MPDIVTDAIKLAESDTIFIKHNSDVMLQGVYIRIERYNAMKERVRAIPTCCMECVLDYVKEMRECLI